MTGGTIVRCDDCGRLLIWGQECVCDRSGPMPAVLLVLGAAIFVVGACVLGFAR